MEQRQALTRIMKTKASILFIGLVAAAYGMQACQQKEQASSEPKPPQADAIVMPSAKQDTAYRHMVDSINRAYPITSPNN
jgi:hypothetical protein